MVKKLHRHHPPVHGYKFAVAIKDEHNTLHGVAIAGRPVARMADNGVTLEVLRVATDGTPNACSMLYGACRKAAWALGYKKVITYTLPSEGGASLRAAGFKCVGKAGGGEWDRPSRRRKDACFPTETKWKWEVERAKELRDKG